jgi:TolB-like protein/DNA-binding winged helix-turn-helix (wHTH) protein/Tfp pilus assembly protein PilF
MNAREPFVLGDWTVHPATGTLTGPAGQRRLTPKLTDLLVALVQRAGQVATRDELLRDVWGERSAVSDEPLTRAVAELRKLLGDVRADPAYIETIPKRGYRVVATVRTARRTAPGSAAPAVAALPLSTPVPLPVPTPVPVSGSSPSPSPPAPWAGTAPAAATRQPWRIAAVALVVAGAAALGVVLAPRGPSATSPSATVSVAVLPFADLSPTADRQYFADGVHEEIVARLTGIAALRIASQSAVDAYRETNTPLREIARELDVNAVMEGTVRYADERVRVTARLTDIGTDSVLWAETFDRALTLEDLFDMQSDIADGVATGLKRSLAVGDAAQLASSMPTASLSAYEAFLLGKYHYRRKQPGDNEIAIEQFQNAVDADQSFAVAWDWLAFAWNDAGAAVESTTPARAFPRARAAALRALELDSKLATSSALLGYLRATYDWDWQAGLAELERAVAAAPMESGTVWSYAYVLSLLGRHDEAIDRVRALAAAFPEEGRLKQEIAERLIDAGRFAEVVELADAAVGGGAERGQIEELLGCAAFGRGDFALAAAELERAVALQQRAAPAVGRLAAAYARIGRDSDARALLAELEAKQRGATFNVATVARVYAALGESDRALALLAQGADERQRDVLGLVHDPFFAALRGEPQFARIVERMGLTPAAAAR